MIPTIASRVPNAEKKKEGRFYWKNSELCCFEQDHQCIFEYIILHIQFMQYLMQHKPPFATPDRVKSNDQVH